MFEILNVIVQTNDMIMAIVLRVGCAQSKMEVEAEMQPAGTGK